MKKLLWALCVFLIAALLCPMSAYAEIGNAAPDAVSGYCSLRFDIPGTSREVFLTGIPAARAEQIKSRIIEEYTCSTDFTIEDPDFIDVEKTAAQDVDDDFCWAAAASNMLTSTGWAAQAGFEATDDVFDGFVSSFTAGSGNLGLAVGWFLDGDYLSFVGGGAEVKAGTGGYLRDYPYEAFCGGGGISDSDLSAACRRMEEGCGVALVIFLYHDVQEFGDPYWNHVITCRGYVADHTYRPDEREYYAGIFFTDSDSDMAEGDRRGAPNVLRAVSIDYPNIGFQVYDDAYAVIESYYWLSPYSAELPKETDSDATRNKRKTVDLSLTSAFLDTKPESQSDTICRTKIRSDTPFYYAPNLRNSSLQSFSDTVVITTQIADAQGNTVFSESDERYFERYDNRRAKLHDGLPAGDYTVTMTVTGKTVTREAYYSNNSFSFPLQVRDGYLSGDADGDGEVTILDATLIQRILADMEPDADDRTRQRAAVSGDEIDILGATYIQRSIVGLRTDVLIGADAYYQ